MHYQNAKLECEDCGNSMEFCGESEDVTTNIMVKFGSIVEPTPNSKPELRIYCAQNPRTSMFEVG